MIEITLRTKLVIAALFPENVRSFVKSELETYSSTNVPGCSHWTGIQLERIWFAVLKLSNGNLSQLESSVKLANSDFRDLLMAASFGHELEAHNKWYKELNCLKEHSTS